MALESATAVVRARRRPWHHGLMATSARVCPYCGEPPGPGMFCAACGRNLAGVDRLPTRQGWAAERGAARPAGDGNAQERCRAATAAFLERMHAAGDPGRTRVPSSRPRSFGRTAMVEGWTVRPVRRQGDAADPHRYEPGLFLTTDGAFHRLTSEVRGWGQRDFPQYHDTVAPDAIPTPDDERLIEELDAVLRAEGVAPPQV
jgi:hypothetical protein